jgi:uncharacterized phage protein gp47/JayE
MPSQQDLPTLTALRDAYFAEVKFRRPYADDHAGSLHDHLGGPGAMLFNRQASRDRRNFRAIYFNTAEGAALDSYVSQRFSATRQVATASSGTAELRRATAAAGAGTVWRGTRIGVSRGGTDPVHYYEVTADTVAGASAVTLVVPVQSVKEGAGFDIAEDLALQFVADPLWDQTWTVYQVRTSGGLDRETADQLRARIRDEQWESRPGYPEAIEAACENAGAVEIVLFASDYLGAASDYGLNRVYVGDTNYQASATLLRDCRANMAAAGMQGTGIQVLSMVSTALTFSITITLWDSPDKIDQGQAKRMAADAVVEYFQSLENPFVWRTAGVRAAVQRVVRGAQSVAVVSSLPEPTLSTLFATEPLPRYSVVGSSAVTVALEGPSS